MVVVEKAKRPGGHCGAIETEDVWYFDNALGDKGKRLLWCLDVLIVLGAWWEFQEVLLDLTMGRMGDGAIS